MKSIFRYENKPTNNFLGTDGASDAITLFDTGMIRYEHYLFRCATPSEIREVGPFPEVVMMVEKILESVQQTNKMVEIYHKIIDVMRGYCELHLT